MFLHRILQALGLQFLEGVDDAGTRVARLNNIINVTILSIFIFYIFF